MVNWHEYYIRFLNMEKNDRLSLAKDYSSAISKIFTKALGKDKGNKLFLELFSIAVCADDKVSKKEYDLYIELTNSSESFDDFYKEVCEIINNKGIVSLIDNIIYVIGEKSQEAKQLIIDFITIICAINGTITVSEQKFIEKLSN